MADMDYPRTRRDEDLVETLHGERIADPYRWLEDPDSSETAEWVRAQNTVTEAHLATLPARQWFTEQLQAIMHRPRAGTPIQRSGHYFVTRNDGQQNQDVWYVAGSLAELEAGGRVIIDPNTMSADGTTSVPAITVSPDGKTLAYVRSDGGSDWLHFKLLDVATGDEVDDVDIVTKFSAPVWLPDSRSYLYSVWPTAGRSEGTSTEANAGPQRWLHRVGSSDDELVAEFPEDPQLMDSCEVTHDDRFMVMTIGRGTEHTNRVWIHRIETSTNAPGSVLSEPIKLLDAADAEYEFIRNDGDLFYFRTDKDAPMARVVRVDLATFERTGVAALVGPAPEGPDPPFQVTAAGDQLLCATLVAVQPVVTRYALDGTDLGRLDVAGGALLALSGRVDSTDAFVGFSSTTEHHRAFHIDTTTGATRALDLAPGGPTGTAPYSPPSVTVTRRRARSKDGTEVPYFLITADGHAADEPAPTILYGYGGFKIPVPADFRPGWPAWLAAGGALAIANLRGGGEFGTEWYEQGRRANKQNVFDDFIAVGEDLVAAGLTTPNQLAIHGRSNGGLLVGAALTQRPDLFAAAVPGVGVLDLLRFHKFTIGAAWISDFGDPDDAEDFRVARAYSPLHNVQEGTRYPATLVLTGDHDDRVVPLHNHKFTATLQRAQAGDSPVLTRVETQAGHGAGKPTAMVVSEWADWLAFAAHHTGLRIE
jgi:prolyl oligopeptidase